MHAQTAQTGDSQVAPTIHVGTGLAPVRSLHLVGTGLAPVRLDHPRLVQQPPDGDPPPPLNQLSAYSSQHTPAQTAHAENALAPVHPVHLVGTGLAPVRTAVPV